jgi:hypothetical protein
VEDVDPYEANLCSGERVRAWLTGREGGGTVPALELEGAVL